MNSTIEAMLKYHHQARHYPGALIHVEQHGKTLAHVASGALHGYAENQAAGASQMHEHARFRIASLTKGMVSVVALALVDQGSLSLDAPIADVLPELSSLRHLDGSAPNPAPTLRHALSHTAGFGHLGETTDPAIRERAATFALEGKLSGMTREQFLQAIAARPLTAQPGSRFQYGFSTDVVGQMIERVTGLSLQLAMSKHLFAPLEMQSTSFRVDPAEHADMPTAFAEDAAWHTFVAGFKAADSAAVKEGIAADSQKGPLHSGGGGLVSTLADVSAYARMLAHGGQGLLSKEIFAQAMQNQLGPTVPGPYNYTGGGFGFGLAGAIRNDWAPAAFASQPGDFTWSGVTGQTLFIRPDQQRFALMLSSNTASRVIVRFEFLSAVASLAG